MKLVSSIFSIISFLMVINVAWLHSAARLGLQAGAPEWMKAVWGLSVPYFFLLAMFWQAKRSVEVRSMSVEVRRLVKRILVPYFLWCWLGAVWSIALHGVQLKGWEALRYLGLQPGWDPAYQPMWFLKALFVVLCVETVVLNASDFVARKVAAARKCRRLRVFDSATFCDQPQVVSNGWAASLRRMVFPVYVLHSMFVSVLYASGVNLPAIVYAIIAVACSVVVAIGVKKYLPRIAGVLFGGR